MILPGFLIGGFLYFKSQKSVNSYAEIHQGNELLNQNFFELNNSLNYFVPEFYIFFDQDNEIHKELKDKFINELMAFMEINFPRSNYRFKLKPLDNHETNSESGEYFDLFKIDRNALKSSNEPIILINNGLTTEKLSILKYLGKFNSFKVKERLFNLLFCELANDYDELRNRLEYLDSPDKKVIVIPMFDEKISDRNKLLISLFKSKNTRLIIVKNQNLLSLLNYERETLYVYYPTKLPFTTRNLQSVPESDGIDLKNYFNTNPHALQLKYGLYTEKLKLDSQNFEDFTEKFKEKKIFVGYNKFDRIKIQKSLFFSDRNVKKLANLDKSLIVNEWKKPNKHILFVVLPSWSYLKEKTFEFILFDSRHLFDEVQFTISSNLAKKHEIYDSFSLSVNLPQIFLIETKDGVNRKISNFNYFKFGKDMSKYLKGGYPNFEFKDHSLDNLTYVETLNAENFKSKVIEDTSFSEFILEIKHEGCPTCFVLGKMHDHLSQKLKKHGVLSQLRCFRIDTVNDIQYLGEFQATPTYLHCRKNKEGEIVKVVQLDKQSFVFDLRKSSSLDLAKIKYHPNIGIGNYFFNSREFLKKNYDPDMDLSHFSPDIQLE